MSFIKKTQLYAVIYFYVKKCIHRCFYKSYNLISVLWILILDKFLAIPISIYAFKLLFAMQGFISHSSLVVVESYTSSSPYFMSNLSLVILIKRIFIIKKTAIEQMTCVTHPAPSSLPPTNLLAHIANDATSCVLLDYTFSRTARTVTHSTKC